MAVPTSGAGDGVLHRREFALADERDGRVAQVEQRGASPSFNATACWPGARLRSPRPSTVRAGLAQVARDERKIYRDGSSASSLCVSASHISSKYAGAWLPAPYPDCEESLKYEYGINVNLLDRRRSEASSSSVIAGMFAVSTGAWNAPTTATILSGLYPS
jgi:hypothetical protein